MRQQALRKERNNRPTMRVVKGLQETKPALAPLVKTAWNFAYSSLWNSVHFSQKEIDTAKEKIEEYLGLSRNPEIACSIFCQRVLLARQYVNKSADRFIPLPSVWLDRNNANGFAGTKAWYADIKTVRASVPAYKKELRDMADAILDFSEDATVENYHFWRKYFIDKQMPGLLNLFQVVAIQQLCND